VWAVVAVVLCAVVAVVAAVRRTASTSMQAEVPTVRVKRGELKMNIYTRGELRATHMETMTAPPIGGGALQLTHLLHTGTMVKKGELVMEFDPTEQLFKVDQNRSELLQAEEEITKAKADAAVTAAQDKVALLKARFDVRRAELDVQKNELVSAIDARKNDLALEQAQRVLTELQQDVRSRTASGKATIILAEEKRNKAKLAMDQAEDNIKKMRVTAPMDGLIAVEKNENAAGGMFWGGMTLPEYREGDQVEAGSSIAKVIDPSAMELSAQVGELEHNNVRPGQSVDIQLDPLPGEVFHGTVKSTGGISSRHFWEANTGAKFELTIALTGHDERLRPGVTAHIVIHGDPRKNVLYIPRQALFMKDNQRVVFLRNGSSFESREAKIQAENESRAAIEGLQMGAEVALVDPTAARKPGNSNPSESLPGPGGTP
jgi:multidrug efflux pump subunit AcrA (membrane-fusion protein)